MRYLTLLVAAAAACMSAAWPADAETRAAAKIVSEDGAKEQRRMSLRLDARVPEADLKTIAAGLRDKAPEGRKPVSFAFYLPAMTLSQAPWADVRLMPEPRVTINGLRYEEVKAFAAEAARDNRDVIGHWLTAPPALPGKLTIWRDAAGGRHADWTLRTGTKTSDELDEIKTGRGRRFEIKGSNGGYYLATWAGPLELGEGKVVIASAERIAVDREKALPSETPAKALPQAAATAASARAMPAATQKPLPKQGAEQRFQSPRPLRSSAPRKRMQAERSAPKHEQSLAETMQSTLSRSTLSR